MLEFLKQYWSTILVGIVLAGIVALIIAKMIRDRKKGKRSCGCGCENCPSAGMCHKNNRPAFKLTFIQTEANKNNEIERGAFV